MCHDHGHDGRYSDHTGPDKSNADDIADWPAHTRSRGYPRQFGRSANNTRRNTCRQHFPGQPNSNADLHVPT